VFFCAVCNKRHNTASITQKSNDLFIEVLDDFGGQRDRVATGTGVFDRHFRQKIDLIAVYAKVLLEGGRPLLRLAPDSLIHVAPAQSARGLSAVLNLPLKIAPLERFLYVLSQDLRAPTGCTVPSKPSSYEKAHNQGKQQVRRLSLRAIKNPATGGDRVFLLVAGAGFSYALCATLNLRKAMLCLV